MKKSIKLIIGTIFFSLLSCNAVFAATISNSVFSAGEVVTINGSGFGSQQGIYGAICFNDTSTCFIAGNSGIKSWSDSTIEFIFPSKAITTGTIRVYAEKVQQVCTNYNHVENYCYSETSAPEVAAFNYQIRPTILSVNSSDESEMISGLPGDIVVIQGYYFGSSKSRVTFSGADAEIINWSDNSITVKIPSVSREKAKEKVLSVYRNASISGDFEFEVKVAFGDDPLSGYQDYLENAKIDKMWALLSPKTDVIVAVIDDGVYSNHEDIQGKFWSNSGEVLGNGIDDDDNGYTDDKYGWDFLYNSNDITPLDAHGTTVAGIIGAIRNNGVGMAGIADRVKIMPLIACSEEKGCPVERVIEAIYYAIDNGAKVINLSLSGNKITDYSTDYDNVISYANSKGIVLVIAAGNGDFFQQGINTSVNPISPVCNETRSDVIIGVGASTRDNKYRTDYTNFGECIDIFAQGDEIVNTSIPTSTNDFFYNIQDGTSFSAPIVTGVVAALLSAYPGLTPASIYNYLVQNSDNQILNAQKVAQAVISDNLAFTSNRLKRILDRTQKIYDRRCNNAVKIATSSCKALYKKIEKYKLQLK